MSTTAKKAAQAKSDTKRPAKKSAPAKKAAAVQPQEVTDAPEAEVSNADLVAQLDKSRAALSRTLKKHDERMQEAG